MAVLKGGLPRFMHRVRPGALDRAGFFDYPERSIFPLRDRSGPVKQALVSKMVFRRVDFGPRYSTRIALMSSRRLLPSRGLHCTEIPRFPGRGRRQGTNHIAGLWGPGSPLYLRNFDVTCAYRV